MASDEQSPATLAAALQADALVLGECDKYVDWYERNKVRMRRLDNMFQATIILSASATSFVVAVDVANKFALAIPAFLTTLATAAAGAFRFRAKYVGFAVAAEKLKFERLSYRLRASAARPAPDGAAKFADAIRAVVSDELGTWRELQSDTGQSTTKANE